MLLERKSDGRDHNEAYRTPGIWFGTKGWSCNRFFCFSDGHAACAKKKNVVTNDTEMSETGS